MTKANEVNSFIEKAKAMKENFEDKVKAINAEAESEKSRVADKFREQRTDIKDIIALSNDKIKESNNALGTIETRKTQDLAFIDSEAEKKIQEAIAKIKEEADIEKEEWRKKYEVEAGNLKEVIHAQQNRISAKEQELLSLDSLEKAELKAVDEKVNSEVEKEKLRVGKAANYLENNRPIDVKPLQDKADEIGEMQSYLREWDRMKGIMDGELSSKKGYSLSLTNKIETARNKPTELLKTHKLPIEGISVDENGMIRITGTLLDGLSDGEKLENAFKIAIQRMGTLRIICLDGFEKLNDVEKQKVIKICEDNDIQTFITITTDTETGEFEIR